MQTVQQNVKIPMVQFLVMDVDAPVLEIMLRQVPAVPGVVRDSSHQFTDTVMTV